MNFKLIKNQNSTLLRMYDERNYQQIDNNGEISRPTMWFLDPSINFSTRLQEINDACGDAHVSYEQLNPT